MTKSESITARLTPAVKTAVERAARARQETIATFTERVLVAYLSNEGYLGDQAAKLAPKVATVN